MIEKILRSLFLKQNKSPVSKSFWDWLYPTNISMFKFSDKDTRKKVWNIFIVNFEHIWHLFSSVSIVDFEQVNVSSV